MAEQNKVIQPSTGDKNTKLNNVPAQKRKNRTQMQSFVASPKAKEVRNKKNAMGKTYTVP